MSKNQHPAGTFAFLPSALAVDPGLGRPGLRVGCLLAAHANAERYCWISTETMARKLRSARSTVQEGLAQLVARGHVVKKERPGRTSVYLLIFRHPDELDDRAGGDPVPRSGGEGSRHSDAADEATVSRGHEVTGFPEGGDCRRQSGVTVPDGRNQYDSERRDRDDEVERARERRVIVDGWEAEDAAARQSFNELADRKGWPSGTDPLTQYERSRLYVRLDECGGLDGWAVTLAAAERSASLARKQPNLRAFLNDQHFWQWMDRRRASKPAPPVMPIPEIASQMSAGLEQDGKAGEIDMGAAPSREAPPESVAPPSPAPPAPKPPPVDPLAAALAVVKVVSGVTTEQMEAEVSKWRGLLAAAGCDEAATVAILTNAAQRVPGTRHAFVHLQQRIERAIAARGGAS